MQPKPIVVISTKVEVTSFEAATLADAGYLVIRAEPDQVRVDVEEERLVEERLDNIEGILTQLLAENAHQLVGGTAFAEHAIAVLGGPRSTGAVL